MIWKNVFKGTAMGMVETVPGVSSSTIAILLGIYGQIIAAINDLTTKRWKKAILFLIPVGIGMGVGFVISIRIVKFFLDHFTFETHFFFMGLIIGMLPFLFKEGYMSDEMKPYRVNHYVIMLISFLLAMSLNFIPEKGTLIDGLTIFDYVYLFVSGWLASIALVLPGISGALILMIVGAYNTAITAVLELNLPIIIVIATGIIVGILLTSKFVKYMLEYHLKVTYSFMIGLIAGSLTVLYPGFSTNPIQIFISLLALFAGVLFVIVVSKRRSY